MKSITLIWLLVFLSSCSYEPVYSFKNISFSIEKISSKDTKLDRNFSEALKILSNTDANKKFNLDIKSEKVKTIKAKNSKGDPEIYELTLKLSIQVTNQMGKEINTNLQRSINFNNETDKFKLRQYEKELEKILFNRLIEDTLRFLSNVLHLKW